MSKHSVVKMNYKILQYETQIMTDHDVVYNYSEISWDGGWNQDRTIYYLSE